MAVPVTQIRPPARNIPAERAAPKATGQTNSITAAAAPSVALSSQSPAAASPTNRPPTIDTLTTLQTNSITAAAAPSVTLSSQSPAAASPTNASPTPDKTTNPDLNHTSASAPPDKGDKKVETHSSSSGDLEALIRETDEAEEAILTFARAYSKLLGYPDESEEDLLGHVLDRFSSDELGLGNKDLEKTLNETILKYLLGLLKQEGIACDLASLRKRAEEEKASIIEFAKKNKSFLKLTNIIDNSDEAFFEQSIYLHSSGALDAENALAREFAMMITIYHTLTLAIQGLERKST